MCDLQLVDLMAQIIGDEVLEETDANAELLSYYLDIAATKILNRRYPFGWPKDAKVEPQYTQTQLEIAVYLFNKRGAEGESLHSENGVSRSYGGQTDVPPDLLIQVTPKGRVY